MLSAPQMLMCRTGTTPAVVSWVNRCGAYGANLESQVTSCRGILYSQEIYRWVKMWVNLFQVSKSTALNGYIQPGPQRFHRILSCSYCLVLSGHFVTSFQLCNCTMNTQHLFSVMFETCLISVWMTGYAGEQLWKDSWCSSGEHCLSTDSSGSMWSILAGAIAVIMVCSGHFLIGIYWYNLLKRRLCESAPSLHWNVSQAGNITSSANLDPHYCWRAADGTASRADGTLQNDWGLVVRRRKWPDFELYSLFWAEFGWF